MKCLFLDHYGVMCLTENTDYVDVKNLPKYGELINFDINCVGILNEIIIETNTEIVISSDWKQWCSFEKMGNFYISQNIIKPPLCFTPNVIKQNNILETRSLEIKTFIENNFIEKWCVVDDLYLGDYLTNFVWVTKTNKGICQENIKVKIIEFLN